MVYAIAHHQFEKARRLFNQEPEAQEHLRLLRENAANDFGVSC
jgi:hypothetical protein